MAAMPKGSSLPNSAQTVIDFDAPTPAPVETTSSTTVAEPPAPAYSTRPAWIDTAGRTRTWALINPQGTQLAEITTKSAAQKLAVLLSRKMAASEYRR